MPGQPAGRASTIPEMSVTAKMRAALRSNLGTALAFDFNNREGNPLIFRNQNFDRPGTNENILPSVELPLVLPSSQWQPSPFQKPDSTN